MSQNLVSNLTLRIEQEKQMMSTHQADIELFQQNTSNLLSNSEQSLQRLELNAQRTTENAIHQMAEAKLSLISVQNESQNLAQSLQQQTKETATLLNQQSQQLNQLKAQSAQLNNMSQDIAESAKIKKTLFTSNMVLASISLILLISSISLGYVSKSKYNDIEAMQNQVNYLKSQGGSMITTTCGGKLCVELDPNHMKDSYALDKGQRPLGIVREVR